MLFMTDCLSIHKLIIFTALYGYLGMLWVVMQQTDLHSEFWLEIKALYKEKTDCIISVYELRLNFSDSH